MATEIERKFLVVGEGWRDGARRSERLRQGYIANSGTASVRVRVGEGRAWLNIKAMVVGPARDEFEYEIPLADGETLLARLAAGDPIDKTRYWVEHGGHEWEIDEFHGANEGLLVAEIELDDVDEAFPRPDWIGGEVTELPRYYNVSLIAHPFREWSEVERSP